MGAAVFMLINHSGSTKRKVADVEAIRACWADIDDDKPRKAPLTPSVVVQSSVGGKRHVYWVLNGSPSPEEGRFGTPDAAFEAQARAADAREAAKGQPPEPTEPLTPEEIAALREMSSRNDEDFDAFVAKLNEQRAAAAEERKAQ